MKLRAVTYIHASRKDGREHPLENTSNNVAARGRDADRFRNDDGDDGWVNAAEGMRSGARVFREKEKRGSSARVSRRNRWLNRAVKQFVARGVNRGGGGEKVRVGKVGLSAAKCEQGVPLLPYAHAISQVNCLDYLTHLCHNRLLFARK